MGTDETCKTAIVIVAHIILVIFFLHDEYNKSKTKFWATAYF